MIGRIRDSLLRRIGSREPSAQAAKEAGELAYWKERKRLEKALQNQHYVHFYTAHFDLTLQQYLDKRVLDVGCGPRGSLEWADMASIRIGLDPLAHKYAALGASEHKMTYVNASAEAIPFGDGCFDVICSFNSLDHVADLDQSVREIKRTLGQGGLFLLLSDVDHESTICEPVEFSWDIVDRFLPEFEVLAERHYEKLAVGMYDSIRQNVVYDHADQRDRYGITSVKFIKL
jgi:SAM-dependent methyltransferase